MSAAAVQSRLASLSVSASPLSPLHPPNLTDRVKQLLRKNNEEHDIFFNDQHFHNHFPHTLLSQFALGAPDSRIEKEWKLEDYLSPLGPKQSPDITDDNWKEHIGVDKYYHNYLDYFKKKIAKDGPENTVLKYAFDDAMLPSFVSGAVHPLIHTGFGVEFGSDILVAEGLAEGCVTGPSFAPVVDSALYSKSSTDNKSLLEIAEEIRKHKTFDGVVKFSDFPKSEPLLRHKLACDRIKDYVMKWKIDESPEGFAKAWTELFELVTHFTVSSAFPPQHIAADPKYKDKELRPLLDFFLVHTLTATYALRAILPYIPMDKRRLALRVDLAAGLTYYVARGRPVIQPEKLPKTPYTWEEITEKTWTDEDLHVPKVIRALRVVGRDIHEMDEELARNAAGLVVREKIDRKKRWAMLGHGFDDAWEKISQEQKEHYGS